MKIKQIYSFADDYLRSWFPILPPFAAFDNRLNRLSEDFKRLAGSLLMEFKPSTCSEAESVLKSLQIITCSGKHNGKVACEITDKGYRSTNSMYYFGLKLHALAFRHPNKLPFLNNFL